MRLAVLLFLGALVSACGPSAEDLGPCAPVDVGGECFAPSNEGFLQHALTSADAWPQLDGVELSADRVIEGVQLPDNTPIWLVPIMSDNRMVAISRFVAVERDQVKLGEVALLERPLPPLPADVGGELVLFVDIGCVDDASVDCLFGAHRWAVRLADGRFRLPDGRVVDEVPARPG